MGNISLLKPRLMVTVPDPCLLSSDSVRGRAIKRDIIVSRIVFFFCHVLTQKPVTGGLNPPSVPSPIHTVVVVTTVVDHYYIP